MGQCVMPDNYQWIRSVDHSDHRPYMESVKRMAADSPHGSACFHHMDLKDRPRRFFAMFVSKQDWIESSGLIEIGWDWKAMQRGEKWARR